MDMLGFVVQGAGFTGLLLSGGLWSSSPIGWVVQLMALVWIGWARWSLGRRSLRPLARPGAGGVVRSGPYRWTLHPIYAAACAIAIAGVASRPQPVDVALVLVVLVGARLRVHVEERRLVERYPEYAAHRRATPRWIPGLL